MNEPTNKSCYGCKFLYEQQTGYSNYTVEGGEVRCAKDANPNLPADTPQDWNMVEIGQVPDGHDNPDNWPKTNQSRCDRFKPGSWLQLAVDEDDDLLDGKPDLEQVAAICWHADVPPLYYSKGTAGGVSFTSHIAKLKDGTYVVWRDDWSFATTGIEELETAQALAALLGYGPVCWDYNTRTCLGLDKLGV